MTRRVWSLALRVNGSGEASPAEPGDIADHTTELGGTTTLGGISAFGMDAVGELYIVSHSSGTILKIVGLAHASGSADEPPDRSLNRC